MAQPLLHFGDVCLVLQRVGRGCRPQRMRPHALAGDADLIHVAHHDVGVHAAGHERAGQDTELGRADAPKQRAVRFLAMATGRQVLGHQTQRVRVRRQEAQLAALALHAQVGNAPALLGEVLDAQPGEFLAAQRVKQQHGQDGAVALALERAGRRPIQQRARLRVTQRRGFPFECVDGRAPDAPDRAVQHGVALAQVVIKGSERGQLAPDARAGEVLFFQLGAPGQDVGARH